MSAPTLSPLPEPGPRPGAVAPPGSPSLAGAVGRRTLAVIAGVVAVAVVVGLAAGVLLTGNRAGAGLGPSAAYVPADAALYAEARLDLPGDQRQQLRSILERFPAVEPDEVLGAALAATLDEALADAGAPIDYSTDVAPWFSGRVGVAVLDTGLDAQAKAGTLEVPAAVVLFGVRDRAAATAVADALRAELEADGAAFSTSEHDGVTLWELEAGDSLPMEGASFAYALTDDQLLLATGGDTLQTALDVHAGAPALAARDDVQALASGLPPEPAGIAVVNSGAIIEATLARITEADPQAADALRGYLAEAPAISVGTIAFEADAVLTDGASTRPGGPAAPSNARRDLAARVPSDAILFADASGIGPMLREAMATLSAAAAAAPDGEQAEGALHRMGAGLGAGLDDLVGWVGDGALAAGWDGTQAWAGLVIEANDAEAARQQLDQLRGLVALAQLGGGDVDVDVASEQVDGVEVTTIRVTGGSAELPMDEVVLEYAVDGDTALIGIGDGFVGRALALDGGDASLAGSQRFARAAERVGGLDNAGTLWLDLAALRDAALAAGDATLPAEAADNLAALDYLVGVSRVDGEELVSRTAVVLR